MGERDALPNIVVVVPRGCVEAQSAELLFDLAWRRSDSCPDIILSMESEWGDEGEVVNEAHTEECREAGSEEQLLKEVRQAYSGKVVAGHDLEIF